MSTVRLKKIYAKLSEDLVVNKGAVKESIISWLEELKNNLANDSKRKNASQELQKALQKKEKLTEVYLEEIISKDDYRAKYEALESRIKELQSLVEPIENNEDIKEIEEVLKNIDEEIDTYIASDGFEASKVDFLIEHTTRITVDNKHLIIELDLIGGAIIAGKDFLLFVHDSMIVVVTDRGLRDELSKRNAEIAGIEDGRDPFYGAPAVLVVLTKSDWQNKVYDGSLVMGNLMNAAHALGLGSCWIHRAKQEFETEWGRQLLRSLGVSGEYEGIGHCVLGYVDGDLPQPAPRKEGRVFYADCLFGGRAAAERGESVRTSGEINSSAANSG